MDAKTLAAFFLPLLTSCSTESGDYRCAKLISSKKETLYVKTYNWGINGDSQLSTLADNDVPIGFEDKGKSAIVAGLEPFIYRFAQDTLTLYSRSTLPSFPLHCSSITVRYELVDNPSYMNLHRLLRHKPYYSVPESQPGDAYYQPKL
ncbi:MAG: hypothetical protein EOO61_17405 [Hymenobacter sp.]|nr:MAG: hypothetical protein EOO61_17405 [Hymenobacter sp.]